MPRSLRAQAEQVGLTAFIAVYLQGHTQGYTTVSGCWAQAKEGATNYVKDSDIYSVADVMVFTLHVCNEIGPRWFLAIWYQKSGGCVSNSGTLQGTLRPLNFYKIIIS